MKKPAQDYFLAQLHPLTKGSFLTLILCFINFFPTKLILSITFVVLIVLCTMIPQKRAYVKRALLTNLFLFFPMLLMQILFKPGDSLIFSWFIFRVSQESIIFAVTLFCRLCLVSSYILLFFHVTKIKELTISLEEIGVPKAVTYIFLSTMMLAPQTIQRSKTIMQAQQVRGIETEGKFFSRVKAFVPIITPLILSSLLSTEERALTLEARAFSSKNGKVYLNSPQKKTQEDMFIKLFFGGSLLLLVAKVVLLWL